MTGFSACTPSPKPDNFIVFQFRRLMTGLAWSVFGIGGLILSITWFPLLNAFVKDKKKRVRCARATISASFRLFFRFTKVAGVMDFELDGIHDLNKVRGGIIIANHPTILDYVFIASQMPQLDCLVKAGLKKNFFLKGVVKAADYLINDASEELVRECDRRLAEGSNILIFPEGTRTVPDMPMKLHRGVAHIALRCRCQLYAVWIHCSDRWLDKSSQWYEIPKSKPKITLRRGPQISAGDFIDESEEGFSLASRRLTRHLTQVLSTSRIESTGN